MSLPYPNPADPSYPNPYFQDNEFVRGDQMRGNNQFIWENLGDLDTRVTSVEGSISTLTPEVARLSLGLIPGRNMMPLNGRRTAASATFPWHPIAVTRTFAQAAAPDFFDFLYDNYMDSDGVGTFLAEELGRASNYVSGVQRVDAPGTSALAAILQGVISTGALKSYDYTQNDYPHGIGGSISTLDPHIVGFSANVSTNVLTLNTSETASVVMWTGIPVTVVKATLLTNAIVGGIVYLRAVTSTTATLHPTAQDAIDGTNTIDLTGTNDNIQIDISTAQSGIVLGANTAGTNIPVGNYTITGIDVNSSIFLQTASNSTFTGDTFSAGIYKNRIAGSTTSAVWNAVEDAAIMTPREDGSIANGAQEIDRLQDPDHVHQVYADSTTGGSTNAISNLGIRNNATPTYNLSLGIGTMGSPIYSGPQGVLRTSSTTQSRALKQDWYVYVGENTL